MNVFVDTNVFLTFFHLTNESLVEMQKTFVLQKHGKLVIWLPEQVLDEFKRNRDGKIAGALKIFEEERLNNQIPQFVRGYPEFTKLNTALKDFKSAKDTLLDKVNADINSGSLAADKLVQAIFAKAKKIPRTPKIVGLAKTRSVLGNPPGKADSIGDAINWESLLEAIPSQEDIHFVTDDGDYYNPMNEQQLNRFLLEEYALKKQASVFTYRRLSQFLTAQFPGGASHATELEKDILIGELVSSGTFARTHYLIKELAKHTGFTIKQAGDIADAYIANPQVFWIISDADVQSFGRRIEKDYGGKLDPGQLKAFLDTLAL